MNDLTKSWNSFSDEIAKKYLKTFGHPSTSSKELLVDVLEELTRGTRPPSLIELGCGNAQIAEYFVEREFECSYTGIDFSEVLLGAARQAVPGGTFIQDDVNTLTKVSGRYDIALYSHVLELLTSPEESLAAAKRLADKIVIRFYEPPEFDIDSVELRWMDVGQKEQVPFIRRKMSRDYYRLILARIGCKNVDIYRDTTKDQVHVLTF
ncbi:MULTISPECIES: class I SAM-dependent methyltransferase [unclassified Herbaspirillum]|uniref:class I SAM-dependent methyltransferase n=1 Tax=unclassified Herbaspirillum TaxID=2624150 RepID=UPI0012F662D8|nr:class I SAM-dependent methyltransferase [Herbaspirillum sp. GW103]NUT60276.1 class I SAM-dependent methyltransferase [Herbaspirillum sp. C9C3]